MFKKKEEKCYEIMDPWDDDFFNNKGSLITLLLMLLIAIITLPIWLPIVLFFKIRDKFNDK